MLAVVVASILDAIPQTPHGAIKENAPNRGRHLIFSLISFTSTVSPLEYAYRISQIINT